MAHEQPNLTLLYYSRSGTSRDAAKALGARLGVTPREITTSRYSWPVLGFLAAGRDGMRGAAAPLKQPLNLPDFGTVILVGPVWVGGAASPLNTVIDAMKGGQQEVAVLLTCGDANADTGPLLKLQARLGRALKAELVLANGMGGTHLEDLLLDGFANMCRDKAVRA